MRIKLIHGGDFSRFGYGVCESGTVISIPESDARHLVNVGAVEELQPLSQIPVTVTIKLKESSNGAV